MNGIVDIQATRPVPHSLEAETAVLGAILLHNEILASVQTILTPADFWRGAHRLIYETVIELAGRNAPIDTLSVIEALGTGNNLDAVGGAGYISNLIDGVPRSINADYYAQLVREKARLRQLILDAGQIIEEAYGQADTPDDIVGAAMTRLHALATAGQVGGLTPMRAIVSDGMNVIEQLAKHHGGLTGVPSGLTDLDAMTAGFQPTDLIIVGARPSMGKTALAMNIAEHVATHGRAVAVFSLEMSKEQLFLRMVASTARIDLQRLRTGQLYDRDYSKLADAVGRLSEARLFIDDRGGLTVTDIGVACKKLATEDGLDLVIVDYLQLMRGASGKRFENRTNEVSQISRDMKALAKELRVPIIVLSQLSRATESRSNHRPMLSDLRESGSIEQDADVVIFPYRPDHYDDEQGSDAFERERSDGMAEIIIGKQRNGPTGKVDAVFLKPFARFENYQRPIADRPSEAIRQGAAAG